MLTYTRVDRFGRDILSRTLRVLTEDLVPFHAFNVHHCTSSAVQRLYIITSLVDRRRQNHVLFTGEYENKSA